MLYSVHGELLSNAEVLGGPADRRATSRATSMIKLKTSTCSYRATASSDFLAPAAPRSRSAQLRVGRVGLRFELPFKRGHANLSWPHANAAACDAGVPQRYSRQSEIASRNRAFCSSDPEHRECSFRADAEHRALGVQEVTPKPVYTNMLQPGARSPAPIRG